MVVATASGLASIGRFTQVTLQDLAVQRAVQHELESLRPVAPSSFAFLSEFLNGGLAECGARLDGLMCPGDEYLLALQLAPRLGDVEPAQLTARVARSAAHIADCWVRDLERIAGDSSSSSSEGEHRRADDDSRALERWCTLQAAALLVRSKAKRLAAVARDVSSEEDLVSDFEGSASLSPRALLSAKANLAVVAAFAAEWMPHLVRGGDDRPCHGCDDTAAAALQALAAWPLPSDLPGAYLVDAPSLALALRHCRVRIASKAAQSLHAFKCHDLFDFVQPQFYA